MTHDPCEHFVEHSAEAPPIDFVAVWQALDNLGRQVLCSPAERARRVAVPDGLARPPSGEFPSFLTLHPRGRGRL